MDIAKREFLLARIVSGCLPCLLQDPNTGKPKTFLLKTPSRLQRLVAQRVYQDALKEAELDGALSEKELLTVLVEEGVWDAKNEVTIKAIEKDIEEFKVKLFTLVFRSYERKLARKGLAAARAELDRLQTIKASYMHASAQGAASIARARYLIGASLHYFDGRPVFADEDAFWVGNNSILESAFEFYNNQRVEEVSIRELARTEPWRSTWTARKAEGSVFGTPACDLSEEQKLLVVWTGIYDNIFEHPESPSDTVLEDDDALDGWLIVQRRRRSKEKEVSRLDELVPNESIRNSNEVFVMADTVDDAKEIDGLNDAGAAAIKRKRIATIKEKGSNINETEMPDSKLQIQAQAIELIRQSAK